MEELIEKHILGIITREETMQLRRLLEDSDNEKKLAEILRNYHDFNLAVFKNDVDSAYEKVLKNIETDTKPVIKLNFNWLKYAASILFVIGLAISFKYFISDKNTKLIPKDNAITLELDDGTVKTINMLDSLDIKDGNGNTISVQKGNQLQYGLEKSTNQLVYNTMNVPNGKRFKITLSDGTKVHLNAGSSLRYPVVFIESEKKREVFLKGEAFFEVKSNKSRPFIVNADNLDVKVLGTEFNVEAYPENRYTDVVLLNGSVELHSDTNIATNPTVLVPGEKGTMDMTTKSIKIAQVNARIHTAWLNGNLVFREMAFDDIVKELERHYSVNIENTNKTLGKEIFNASFNNIKIDDVLSFFKETHEIDYSIENNTVYIK